jgi:hypothetical protein
MVLTDTAVQKIVDFLRNNAGNPPSHIAIGTDNTSPNASDTSLIAEVTRKSIEETSNDTISVTFSVILLSTESNGNSLKEVGLINAATDGDLYSRFTHAAIDKTSSYEIEYTITIQVAN